MQETKLHQVAKLGQSIWLDYINRSMIEKGKLKERIDQGLRGMTSNPSIFNQVISSSSDYDERIVKWKEKGKSTFEIYDELTVADIQDATDFFKPVYEKTQGLDGYVSLEINPQLADDTKASIKEGKRLFQKVNRPNVMIKVPATLAGFPVIEELLADGVNVNVTLIFSLDQYNETVHAFFRGLGRLSEKTKDLRRIRSVASVFVSRIDTLVDKLIDEKLNGITDPAKKRQLEALKGKAAVANSQIIFAKFKELFAGRTFKDLAKKGAGVQRVLWGSTSTKNPAYSDIKYVAELIANPSVNTVPENTLNAFLDHGQVKETLKGETKQTLEIFRILDEFGISMDAVGLKLLDEGVGAFSKSFVDLLKAIEVKAQQLCSR